MSERYYKTMIVAPGFEYRDENFVEPSPFGGALEAPISEIAKELHIHQGDGKTAIYLESPATGGPFVVSHQGKETLLVPGEVALFESCKITLFIKKLDHIQIIILE